MRLSSATFVLCVSSILTTVSNPVAFAVPGPMPRTSDDSYFLGDDAEFEEGCYAPCMCPILLGEDLKGKFTLSPRPIQDGFLVFEVRRVSWRVSLYADIRVTGSGIYRRSTTYPRVQRMELDLLVNDRPVEHYDSGLVPVTTPFPDIDLTVSKNGRYCYDTVFIIRASLSRDPLPPGRRQPVNVLGDESSGGHTPTTWGRIKALYGN